MTLKLRPEAEQKMGKVKKEYSGCMMTPKKETLTEDCLIDTRMMR